MVYIILVHTPTRDAMEMHVSQYVHVSQLQPPLEEGRGRKKRHRSVLGTHPTKEKEIVWVLRMSNLWACTHTCTSQVSLLSTQEREGETGSFGWLSMAATSLELRNLTIWLYKHGAMLICLASQLSPPWLVQNIPFPCSQAPPPQGELAVWAVDIKMCILYLWVGLQ